MLSHLWQKFEIKSFYWWACSTIFISLGLMSYWKKRFVMVFFEVQAKKLNSIGKIKAALGQIKLIPRKGRRGKVKTFFSSLSKKRFPADSILSWTDPFSWVIFLSFLAKNPSLSICSINCWRHLIPKIDQNMDINIIIVQFWSLPHVSKYNCVLCEQMLR